MGNKQSTVWVGMAMAVVGVLLTPAAAPAQYLRIRDICRVKGQEANTLVGLGLVTGLKGTGDTDPAALASLAKALGLLGLPVANGGKGKSTADMLKNVKNVAVVMVTATIPAEGARQGEQIHCTVSSMYGAKSLEGGTLFPTCLTGPRPGATRVYAVASGPVALPDVEFPTVGTVHDGCRLEEDCLIEYTDESGHVTLVIDANHASFPMADAIEKAINEGGQREGTKAGAAFWGQIAQAVDPVNIRVKVPAEYVGHLVDFISTLLDTQVAIQAPEARVVINERTGVIVVGDKVTVGRVAVTHKNISVKVGDDPVDGPLHIVDQSADTSTTRLKALVDALNALKASPQDIIDIIKNLERSGDLYGKLVVE